jgi:hypothetical protein
MSAVVSDFRVSFVTTDVFLDLLEGSVPTAPANVLANSASYRELFEELRLGGRHELGAGAELALEAPWPKPFGQQFWKRYLEDHWPGDVSGTSAWRHLVPFRSPVPASARVADLGGPVMKELFLYPYGIAFVFSARCAEEMSLSEAVERAFRVRYDSVIDVSWDGEPTRAMTYEQFALAALRRAKRLALGAEPQEVDAPKPFSVFTVVKGRDADSQAAPPPGGELHRVLQALTGWSRTWQGDRLTDLDASSMIGIKKRSPLGHTVHAARRARAVWFPESFQAAGHSHALACYHRNLTLLTMQVESLSRLLVETAVKLEAGDLAPAHRTVAQLAAGVIGRLYGYSDRTYQSLSPRHHVDQNGYSEPANRVRALFGQPPLQ